MPVEVTWTTLRRRNAANAELHEWAAGNAVRRGSRVAAIAPARKLAGILYAMWRDATEFGGRGLRTETAPCLSSEKLWRCLQRVLEHIRRAINFKDKKPADCEPGSMGR
jgi:hypothetical protein